MESRSRQTAALYISMEEMEVIKLISKFLLDAHLGLYQEVQMDTCIMSPVGMV